MIKYFSSVYQITQNCPYKCAICLRRYAPGERAINQAERKKMILRLKEKGLKRLTITGGEPMILEKELFELIEFLHENEIHVCLSTTGHGITQKKLEFLDQHVDQILISIRSLDKEDWFEDFGHTDYTESLYHTVMDLLEFVESTGIIFEVNTVVHKENYENVFELGRQLSERTHGIVWRIDEYYATGIGAGERERFELTDTKFNQIKEKITHEYAKTFRRLKFTSKMARAHSPEYLITHQGDLVDTSGFDHIQTPYNAVHGDLPDTLPNLRAWDEHKLNCRDWGWGDFSSDTP